MRKLTTPLTEEDVKSLHAGDHVLLSGVVYTARDAAGCCQIVCAYNCVTDIECFAADFKRLAVAVIRF